MLCQKHETSLSHSYKSYLTGLCICCWMRYKTIKWIMADVMDGCCKWFFVTQNSRLDNDKLSTVANCKLDWLVHGAAVGSPWRAEIQGRVGHGGHRGVARGTWTWEIVGADAKVGKVGVGERFGSGDPRAGVERQHLAEKVLSLRRVRNWRGQLYLGFRHFSLISWDLAFVKSSVITWQPTWGSSSARMPWTPRPLA